jgi:hypothetical protein
MKGDVVLGEISASIGARFLNNDIWDSEQISHKRCKLGCDRTIIQGTLCEEQCKRSALSRIPLFALRIWL